MHWWANCMSHLCIIPARGGSKRILRKNIKDFCGKPMIAHAIEVAIKSKCFHNVTISTDDEEIAEVGRAYGAEVPFMRPPELADDFTTTAAVMRHAVATWKQQHKSEVLEAVCCLYATAVFVQTKDLYNGLQVLHRNQADYAFSVTTFAFPIQRALYRKSDGKVAMMQPQNFVMRSQDLEEAWHDAGQFYWGNSAAWLAEKPIFDSNSFGIELPRYRVQDIDTLEDWKRAELMYQVLRKQGEVG